MATAAESVSRTSSASTTTRDPVKALAIYLSLGMLFGVVLMKAEVVSWFRVQEMFRFQSPHMYLTIVSAIVTAAVSLQLIGRLQLRTFGGDPIVVLSKELGRGTRYAVGGTLFGLGWGLVGACPAPLFALFGSGLSVFSVIIVSAMTGTWMYGMLRRRLPH